MLDTIYTVGLPDSNTENVTINSLGGKGFHIARMCAMGINVPPAVILPTEHCFSVLDKKTSVLELVSLAYKELERIEDQFGYMPLFSVRSGAPVSLPGMMNTILNVGLTTKTMPEWEKHIGVRAAWDSYRRLIQMFGDVVFEIPSSKYEDILTAAKTVENVSTDAELPVKALKAVCDRFLEITPDFPQTFKMQLRKAIGAVFSSWNTERAIKYRNIHKIPHDLGTAVVVQAMVFGNLNDNSATGVLFTRNVSTGENKVFGEFLVNAQGEDVVAGIRTPLPLEKMAEWNASALDKLISTVNTLELKSKDVQDVEFTIQDGELFILQTRNAKRNGLAAVRIAVDLANEGLIDHDTAVKRVTYDQYLKANRPILDPSFITEATGKGIPAASGFATGIAVFSAEDAVKLGQDQPVILVSKETTPDDIAGMNAAVGILTATGGSSSHAAVVARGMDKVCVVGCTAMLPTVVRLNGSVEEWVINGVSIKEGSKITLNGSTGDFWVDIDVPVINPENDPHIATFESWAIGDKTFIPLITSGKAGYLDTTNYDNTPTDLTNAVSDFDGIVSLNTGKNSISSWDEPLFELVAEYDEEAVKKNKLNAILSVPTTKKVLLDIGELKLTSITKAKITKQGYTVLPTVSSIENLIMSSGLIRMNVQGVTNEVVSKVLSLKDSSGESIKSLVIASDIDSFNTPNAVVVASKDLVLKAVLSA